MSDLIVGHTEFYQQFSDIESFRRWLSVSIFDATYTRASTVSGAPMQEQLLEEYRRSLVARVSDYALRPPQS